MKITDNIAMLEIAGNGGVIYPTLIWGDGHLILADAGFPGQTELIKQAIADAGFNARDLTEIIITHQDMDHVGCVPDLLKLAPKIKILTHIDEAPYIDGRKTPIKLAAMIDNYDNLPDDRKAWCDKMIAALPNWRIITNQELTDGEILPYCGGIEIVHTPGHTPGHICLYFRESKIIVGGDALNITNGQMSGPNPQHTYDMLLGLKSLEKAKKFDISGLISYHCGFLKM
ncbi:MAG: MBL fold metallo-hydrolase [Oscillospiraceae bacterium]|nr:MBL fold metallo-hydrolase [Oscillospiraceae bacterium]